MSNQLCQIACLPGGEETGGVASEQRGGFCQDITPPLHSRLLTEVTSEGERGAYGPSPPHLNPEETDEEGEMKRLGAHSTNASLTVQSLVSPLISSLNAIPRPVLHYQIKKKSHNSPVELTFGNPSCSAGAAGEGKARSLESLLLGSPQTRKERDGGGGGDEDEEDEEVEEEREAGSLRFRLQNEQNDMEEDSVDENQKKRKTPLLAWRLK
ncbi:Hypothetical predicted protein [Scomber scombrus]|uniref:Uncharacterized protein n=1 Tax=Scomber scombrus TaxID=13677 RepID=A0AAV1PFM0_SCOSC